MTEITLVDLQELDRLLKGVSWRLMTEQEIADFSIIPESAIEYQDYGSFSTACELLSSRKAIYEAGSNPGEDLFWTLENKSD